MIDPTVILTPVFGAYTASVISLLAFIGYVIAWVAPLLPPPAPTASPAWKFMFAAVNKIGANVGYAKNSSAPPEAVGQFAQPGVNTAPPRT